MDITAKILNPIYIRCGTVENVVIVTTPTIQKYPLVPGTMIGGEHYGFVLITDTNGKQKESLYPTKTRISGVDFFGGSLRIFEEKNEIPWKFSKDGKILHTLLEEFTQEYLSNFKIAIKKDTSVLNDYELKDPLKIKIAKNPQENILLKNKQIKKNYPLYPGVILGTNHFGFILIFTKEERVQEVAYQTKNRINYIVREEKKFGDLKIFEEGKCCPWVFTYDGKLKQKSSYDVVSKKTQNFLEEDNLNKENIPVIKKLIKKRNK